MEMRAIISAAAIVVGAALVAFGLWDLVTPRARFVGSNPPAGGMVSEAPSTVTLNFSDKLARESTMDVTSTIKLLPSGQFDYLAGRSVVVKSELDSADPSGKSMRAVLQPALHKGLYWIDWRTTTASSHSVTYGRTYFAAGMPPLSFTQSNMPATVWERNYQWRSRRGAIVGGLVMFSLGLYLRRPH